MMIQELDQADLCWKDGDPVDKKAADSLGLLTDEIAKARRKLRDKLCESMKRGIAVIR